MKSEMEALRTVPEALQMRIHYKQCRIEHLTRNDIEIELRKLHPDATLDVVYHIHASPDCTTMSTAEKKVYPRDPDAYRNADGTPNVHASTYRYNKVLQADRALNQCLMLMSAISRDFPRILQTVENPVGAFELQPQVVAMQKSTWKLHLTHYCACANPKYDSGELWSMKPTHILMHGAAQDIQLPTCNFDCPYMIPGTKRHLMSIRIDKNSHPMQQRVEGHQRHAIPGGLFDCITHAHDEHEDHDDDTRHLPCGIFNLLDDSNSQKLADELIAKEKCKAVSCKHCHKVMSSDKAKINKKQVKRWRKLHAQFGHQSDKKIGLKKMKGMHKAHCETCLAAKMCRKAHTGTIPRAAHALGKVYTDLQEFRTPDIDGNKYQAIFVDDKTDRIWTYLMKKKSDYGEKFQLWLSEVGVPPTRVCSDWGGEFRAAVENQFLKVCLERGIWPERSAPYQPQQNKAERGNRTLTNITRSLLMHAKLGKEYWGYAIRHAAYIHMHSISKRTGKTPYEAWYGHEAVFDPPTFGATVHFRHAERDVDKLDNPGHKGRFLGFPSNSIGCFVQDLDHPNKPVRITFDAPESSFQDDYDSDAETVAMDLDEYQLVHDVKAERADDIMEAIPLVADDRTGIPQERISYWHAFQKYSAKRRRELGEGESEDATLSKIMSEWKEKQIAAANEIKQSLDSHEKEEHVHKRLRTHDGDHVNVTKHTPSERATRSASRKTEEKAKPHSVNEDTRCEQCSSPDDEANMLICDACDKGYHIKCIGMSRLPAAEHGWMCHECIKPPMRISVYRPATKDWHNGTITMQYASLHGGSDIEYDDGAREHADLNYRRWTPMYTDGDERKIAYAMSLLYDHIPDDINDSSGYFVCQAQWCPKTHGDILKSNPTVKKGWLDSEDKEWNTVLDKKTVKVVPLRQVPRSAVFVPTKWAYRVKADGSLKSRLCILGNRMPKTEMETSAPTPRLSSVRILLKKAIEEDLEVHILDLVGAFLNSPAQGQTYLRLPPGRNTYGYAALLLRNLYGSTHAPRAWHNMLHNHFTAHGYKPNPHDPCMYSKSLLGSTMHAIVHVDDVGYIGTKEQCALFRQEFEAKFSIEYLGKLGIDKKAMRYLGVNVIRQKDRFILHNDDLLDKIFHQASKYALPKSTVPIQDIRLSAKDSPTTDEEKKLMANRPYRNLLGQIGFLCLTTRSECSYAYKELSRFNTTYGEKHWQALLSLVGYLKQTKSWRFHIAKGGGMKLRAYSDADWNGETDKHLSTTGWYVFLGDTPVSWCSRVQRCTAKSTAEAEYVAASSCTQELVYLQMLMSSISHPTETVEIFTNSGTDKDPGIVRTWQNWVKQNNLVELSNANLHTDSKNAISNFLTPPGWLSESLRHIKTHFHFVKQFCLDKMIGLHHCKSGDNCADIGTKGWGNSAETAYNQKYEVFRKHAKTVLGMPRS